MIQRRIRRRPRIRLHQVLATIIFAAFSAVPLMAQWAPLASDANAQKRIAWWREARVGLFMHWGVYAIPGRGEWVQWNEQIPVSEYAKLMTQFHPEHFDHVLSFRSGNSAKPILFNYSFNKKTTQDLLHHNYLKYKLTIIC